MHRLATLGIATLLLSGCIASHHTAERDVSITAEHSTDSAINVESRNGRIEIVIAPEQAEVVVEATIRCAGDTPEEARERAEASFVEVSRDTSHTLHVTAVFDGGARNNDGASLLIRLPDAAGVHASTGNGSVTIAGTSGSLVATTSNGRITITDHAGPVDCETSNGAVTIRGADGRVKADTSNGAIVVELSDASTGPVDLQTSNGRVEFIAGSAFGGTLSLETSNGRLKLHDHGNRVESYQLERRSGQVIFTRPGEASRIDSSNAAGCGRSS